MKIGVFAAVGIAATCAQANAQVTALTSHRVIAVESFLSDTASYSSGYDSRDVPSDALGTYSQKLDRFLTLGSQWAKTFSSQDSAVGSAGISSTLTVDDQIGCPSMGYAYGHSSSSIDTTFLVDRPVRFTLSVSADVTLSSSSYSGVADFTLVGPAGTLFSLSQSGAGTKTLGQSGLLQPGVYTLRSHGDTAASTAKSSGAKHVRATTSVQLKVFCPADFDNSGWVDNDDYVAFVHAFENGDDPADVDQSGYVDTDDFTAFLLAFTSAC